MSQDIPNLPPFEQVNDVLMRINPDVSSTQLHGLICAFICCGQSGTDQWLKSILEDLQSAESIGEQEREMLVEIQQISEKQLQAMNFEFELLLPDDDFDILQRAQALGDWCYGFLGGVGLAGLTGKDVESEDINEILTSFAEIANVDFESAESTEAAEKSFVEISEFVRMGVIYLYQELVAMPTIEESDDNQYLH